MPNSVHEIDESQTKVVNKNFVVSCVVQAVQDRVQEKVPAFFPLPLRWWTIPKVVVGEDPDGRSSSSATAAVRVQGYVVPRSSGTKEESWRIQSKRIATPRLTPSIAFECLTRWGYTRGLNSAEPCKLWSISPLQHSVLPAPPSSSSAFIIPENK